MVFGRLFRGSEGLPTEQQGPARDEALNTKRIGEPCKAGAPASCGDDEVAVESAEGSTSDLEELKEDGEDWDDWDVLEPQNDGSTVEVINGWIVSTNAEDVGASGGASSVHDSVVPAAETLACAVPPTGKAGGCAVPGSPARHVAAVDPADVAASQPVGTSEVGSPVGQAIVSDASVEEAPVDDGNTFSCLMCRNPIFKADDIISSNYHAQTSPGYLINAARNISTSSELQTATYTTGEYTIQEVMCQRCSATLGVTYSGAAEARNQYKVGKFLVGRDRLQLPPGVVHPMDRAKH